MIPFRVGTTSYIIPDNIVPNVRYLADKAQDIELILFEVDDGQNNLPDADVIGTLIDLAATHGLTYTVHLPLDLRLGEGGDETHISLIKARKVIELTRALNPWAYVLHLDGNDVQHGASAQRMIQWRDQCVRSLEIVSAWSGSAEKLVVENLEGYPPDFTVPVIERIGVSRCFDVGHLWKDGLDPLPYLKAALPRTRVIHIHGLKERDHKSLAHMSPAQLDPVVKTLLEFNYTGVLTLEVFNEEDFLTSKKALAESLERVRCNGLLPAALSL